MPSLDPAPVLKPKKRLIVCCDGTWNNADTKTNETNVARLARAIHGSQQAIVAFQIVLYLRGVGTTGLKLGDLIEGATGFGIDENVKGQERSSARSRSYDTSGRQQKPPVASSRCASRSSTACTRRRRRICRTTRSRRATVRSSSGCSKSAPG